MLAIRRRGYGIGDTVGLGIGHSFVTRLEAKPNLRLCVIGTCPSHERIQMARRARTIFQYPLPGLASSRLHRRSCWPENSCRHSPVPLSGSPEVYFLARRVFNPPSPGGQAAVGCSGIARDCASAVGFRKNSGLTCVLSRHSPCGSNPGKPAASRTQVVCHSCQSDSDPLAFSAFARASSISALVVALTI